MVIGFDAKRLFHNATGLGNYSRTLVRNLYEYFPSHDYQLYTPQTASKHSFFNNNNFKIISNNRLPSTLWRSWWLPKIWHKQGLQLYHGLSNELPLSGTGNIKTILTVHDLIFRRLPDIYPMVDRWIYDKKVKASCQRADCIIAISECTKRDICAFYNVPPSKIRVIYQAAAKEFYQPVYDNHSELRLPKHYFLCVGTLEERKNQLLILKAWKLLKPTFQIPIVLVGRGKSYKKTLETYATTYNIPVHFLDNIHTVKVLKTVYRNAQALIYPSLYEGFGLPVLEALLCKTPVITTAKSAMAEIAGPKGATYIDSNHPDELAIAMENSLSDASIMVEQGHQYAQKMFNPKLLTKTLMDTYKY